MNNCRYCNKEMNYEAYCIQEHKCIACENIVKKGRQEALEEVKKIIEIWWNACISSMHETSPKDKKLLATSGEVEKALDKLLKSYKEDQIKEIKELEK